MDKREVVPKLNELEDLVSEAISRREASPDTQPNPYVPPFPSPFSLPEPLPVFFLPPPQIPARTHTRRHPLTLPRPDLLPPKTVLQAHLSRPLTSATSHLNAKLQNTQSENERLFSEVQAQRAEIEALVSRLETLSSDVDAANGLLGEVVGEIAREGREREAGMEE